MQEKQGYVYLMMNKTNTVIYTGITSNLVKRIYEHKQKMIEGFTKKYNVNKLVYYEVFDDIENAILREKQIKAGSRERKLNLIRSKNREFRDLYDEIASVASLPRNDREGTALRNDSNTSKKVRMVVRIFIFIICLLNFLSLPAAYAAWGEGLSIPLPLSTQEYYQQTMNIAGQDLKLTLYTSSLSKKELRNFYQHKLPVYGWKFEDLSKALKDLSADTKRDTSSLINLMKNTLYFTKDNLRLNLNFLPQRKNVKQTYFSITLGQMNPPIPPLYKGGEGGFRGMESSISVYPAAKQIMSTNSKFSQNYGFVTDDTIEQVSSFYRDDMSVRFNWSLVNESPIQKSSYDVSEQLKQNCPNCGKLDEATQKSLGKIEMYFSALKFKRGEETCLVGISQSEMIEAKLQSNEIDLDSEIGRTMITVVYPVRDKTPKASDGYLR